MKNRHELSVVLTTWNRPWRKLLILLVSFQLFITLPGVSDLAMAMSQNSEISLDKIPNFSAMAIQGLRSKNPVWDEFFKQPTLPQPNFTKEDVDLDPFFLRSQSWEEFNSSSDSLDPSFKKDESGSVLINIPSIGASMRLKQNLTPIHFNDEFIFLSADKDSNLAKEAHGLFFISYEEILTKAALNKPVHIYFFPLPGNEFVGELNVEFIERLDALYIKPQSNDAEIHVELSDVRQIQKVETLNSMMASGLAINSESNHLIDQLKRTKRLELPIPPRGSTVGHGLFYSGINLDSKNNKFVSVEKVQAVLNSIVRFVFPISNANADVLESIGLDKVTADKLQEKITNFAWMFSGVMVASLIIKYTVLHERFVRKNAIKTFKEIKGIDEKLANKLFDAEIQCLEDFQSKPTEILEHILGTSPEEIDQVRTLVDLRIEQENKVNPVKKVGKKLTREFVQSIDTLSHSFLFLMQIPRVVTASTVQNIVESYFPEIGAAENSKLYSFLNKFIYAARKTNAKASVSAKTFWLGSLVMGTVDSSIVAYQEIKLVPDMCNATAPYLPEFLNQRVENAFDPNNSHSKGLIVNDIIRNYIAWITSGAASYSSDAQAQLEPIVRQQVDIAMKREGKNPLEIQHLQEREKRYNELLNLKLKQLGLPDKNDFLFDANTLDELLNKTLGYSAKATELSRKLAEKINSSKFIAEDHPGLVLSTLELVIKDLKDEIAKNPNKSLVNALALAEETRQKASYLSLDILNLGASVKQMREARSILTLLTFSGDVRAPIAALPELWSDLDPEAAQLLAQNYRTKFFSLMSGDKYMEKLPQEFIEANKTKVSLRVEEIFEKKFSKNWRTKVTNAEVINEIEVQYRALFAEQKQLESDRAFELIQDQKQISQQKKALKRTNERVARLLKQGKFVSENQTKRIFAEEAAREIDLYFDKESDEGKNLLKLVESRARQNLDEQLKNDSGLRAHLEKMNKQDRTLITRSLYAEHFIEQYRTILVDEQILGISPRPEFAIDSDASLSEKMINKAKRIGAMFYSETQATGPLSPSQPGRTQKIRQTKFFRHSEIASRFARLVDSFFSDEAGVKLGSKASLYRNIPGYFDLSNAFDYTKRMFLISSTTGFLYQRFFWGINIPYASYVFQNVFAWTIFGPSMWLNRAMRMQGLAPMGGVISKIIYGIPYAMVTFGGIIPWLLFSPDVQSLWNIAVSTLTTSHLFLLASHVAHLALPFSPGLLFIPIHNELKKRAETKSTIDSAKSMSVSSSESCNQFLMKILRK